MEKSPTPDIRIGYQKAAVLVAVLFTQATELLFLQRKYDLFTGGFLQPHSYLTWPERATFIGLSLWMDLVLFSALGLAWFAFAQRRKTHPIVAAYNFVFLSCAVMGGWLAVKYKALTYFNDTLNFLIIRNLGGGSLVEALAYVANEAALIAAIGLAGVFCYWIGLRTITQRAHTISTPIASSYNRTKPWLAFLIMVITVAQAKHINADFGLRYGLSKKTSYTLISAGLDELTDLDRDGFGAFAFPTDPAPMDASIYPGALDIPGNGIDEDVFGGDFIWPGPALDPLAQPPEQAGDHILLIVLESARGDLVGKKWEGHSVTPQITALAENGTSVEYAYSHTGYTTSSIKALFNRTLSTEKDRIPLVEFLDRAGYHLSFISGQDESFGDVASSVGMDGQGRYLFDARSALDDRVFSSTAPGSLRLSEERIIQQFSTHTAELKWDNPQFFYINLQAAHFPYSHPTMPALINDRPIPRPEISAENRQWLQATYWNSIAVADQAIGAMIDRLKALGVYEKTTVMILGDHGESLFDDEFLGHGHALNKTQTWIPLIINRPGLQIRRAVGQLDMAELLIQVATHQFDPKDWNGAEKCALQIVGTLHNPQLVGTVSYGDVRTILDLRTRKVFFSDLSRWEDFDQAWNDPQLSHRVKQLIEKWETMRWRDHLSRRDNKTMVTTSE